MLLLPDQTYEQYRGETVVPHSPLGALKRILGDVAFGPKPAVHFAEPLHTTVRTPPTNGKRSTTATTHGQRNRIANVQSHLEAFFGVMGNTHTGTKHEQRYREYRVPTPEGFEQTAAFFNNIPEFHGEAPGPFSIPKHNKLSYRTEDLLKECEELLNKYRIKPDFFCRYRKAME